MTAITRNSGDHQISRSIDAPSRLSLSHRSMPVPRLFYTDQYVLPLPDGHKFPAGKYRLVRELLAKDSGYTFEPAPMAEVETIELAHDSGYVRGLLQGNLPATIMRRIGLPWSEMLV